MAPQGSMLHTIMGGNRILNITQTLELFVAAAEN